MSATATPSVLDRMLDPVRDCLTPEVARRILALRADPVTQAKLDEYAEKNAGGTITPAELDEYDAMVQAGNMIAVLQAKARAVVGR
ncbi:hypothetical protein [Urbifossiella limnaea]|uniref:Uncharacterized protein n=1 Tax=Urbifossiella limnaea TaxID=2528023 RepID=A0A517XRE9_9BACT|nr:hypothetical protein [Urbifossiella limnaea]QDU20084.1 hypothetical protein ETAA1_20270 [Urbifossiella limnaea]